VFLCDRSLVGSNVYVQTPVLSSTAPRTLAFRSLASTRSRRTVKGLIKAHKTSFKYTVRIYKWRKVSGHWKARGYTTATVTKHSTYSRYSSIVTFNHKGSWRIRARTLATKSHKATWSAGYRYLTVK
jgi:hypothetical protein